MPKRNLAWMLVILLIAMLFWLLPESLARMDALRRAFAPLLAVRAQIDKYYVEDVDDEQLLRGAIHGMLLRLDPFSSYIWPEQYPEFKKRMNGKFGGIGIELGVIDGVLTVISPIEDTPAFHGGVLAGDQILEIDGEPTDNLSIDEAVARLTGKPGTPVSIRVRHRDTGLVERIDLHRAMINIISVKGWRRTNRARWDFLIDPLDKIGYVRISAFQEDTPHRLDAAVRGLLQQGMAGLILDLRFNPGGLLESAVATADRFLSSGIIVTTRSNREPPDAGVHVTANPENTYPRFPLVILVNGTTASGGEIVAGCLQDHRRAVIVGSRTFGKGSVQNVIEMPDHRGALKLTTAYYYLPSGRRIHRTKQNQNTREWGVIPDALVKLTETEMSRILAARREADIIRLVRPTTTQPTGGGPNHATTRPVAQPATIAFDRQLRRALYVLRRDLHPAPPPHRPPGPADRHNRSASARPPHHRDSQVLADRGLQR